MPSTPHIKITAQFVTGPLSKGVEKAFSFMKRMASTALKGITGTSSREMGKVSKNMQNLIPPNFYNRIDAITASLGKFATATSYKLDVAGNKLKSFRLHLKDLPSDSKDGVAAAHLLRDAFSDMANVSIESLGKVIKHQDETTSKSTELVMKIKQAGTAQKSFTQQVKQFALAWKGAIPIIILKSLLSFLKKIITSIKNAIKSVLKLAVAIGKTLFNAAKSVLSVMGKIAQSILSIPLGPIKALASSLSNVGTIIAGMVGYGGLKTMGRQLKAIAEEAGPIQSVRIMFINFMQQAVHNVDDFNHSADEMIQKMRDMTHGAIETTTMLKFSNLAFSLIGDTVGKDLPKMLAIAQAASLATGETMERMFSSLVKGVGRLSTRWLDNLGITLSTKEEYARFAEQMDLNVKTMTHMEKVQAMLNGAMREGTKILLRTGDASLFLATQMNALVTTMKNTRDAVIHNFAPIFTAILEVINDFALESQKRINQWTKGFTDGFARMPEVIYKVGDQIVDATANLAQVMIEPLRKGREQAGYEAGAWAADALGWGANVGANFAIGILDGFKALIIGVMNAIASILRFIFGPGSPPNVAPNIDMWGYDTIGEWVMGMLSYPVDSTLLPALKDSLRETFGGDVKDELFQWGVDALAAWTEGLSIIDLEFLTKAIEQALNKAKRLNKELTKSYKKQNTELFKMQVLGKSPDVIRAQLAKVKTSKLALRTNENEISVLEERRDIIREQLDLMRLMKRALDKMAESAKKAKKKAGAGAGDIMGELGIPDIARPLTGTGGLANLLEGVRKTFKEALEDPIKRVKAAWLSDLRDIKVAWRGLVATFNETKPGILGFFGAIKKKGQEALGFLGEMFGFGVDMPEIIWEDPNIPEDLKHRITEGMEGRVAGAEFAKTVKEMADEVIAGVQSIIDWFDENKDTLKEHLENIGTWIAETYTEVKEEIGKMITEVKPDFDEMVISVGGLAEAFGDLYEAVFEGETIAKVIKTIGNAASYSMGLVSTFAAALERVVNALTFFRTGTRKLGAGDITGGLSDITEGMFAFPSMADILRDLTMSGGKSIIKTIFKPEEFVPSTSDIQGAFSDVGKAAVDGFNTGIEANATLSEAVIEQYGYGIREAMEMGLDIRSPSGVFVVIGENVVDGFNDGIEDNTLSSKVTMYKWVSDIIKATRIGFGAVGMGTPSTVFNQIANDIILGFKGGFEEDREALMQFIYDFMDEAVWTAHGVAANAYSVGKAFSGGIEAGIRDGIDGIIKAAKEAAYAALHGVRQESETESPSRKFREAGRDMIAGLNQGLSSPIAIPSIIGSGGINTAPRASDRSTVVHLHGPIVENMIVPNAVAGRKVARNISKEISAMAMLKRNPA